MIFKDLVKIKNKRKGKTAAISPSNRSERLCEQFCESEEAGQMILLSMEEKHIRPKVEGGKNNFFSSFRKRWDWLGLRGGPCHVRGPK